MRHLASVLVLASLACSARPSFSGQACEKIDSECTKAIVYLADDAYGLGQYRSEDAEEVQWAHKVLLEKGKAALPCLLDIYRHGVHGELWKGKGSEPIEGRWTLPIIRAIDGASAIPLYRDLYVGASDPITRIYYASELVSLGDLARMAEVMSFLNSPQNTAEPAAEFERARQHAIAAVAAQNYRQALPTFRKLADDPTVADKHVLALYIAQLSDDVDAVKSAVADGRLRDAALLSLKRMGQDDVLRAIAADRTNPAREAAGLALQGRLSSSR